MWSTWEDRELFPFPMPPFCCHASELMHGSAVILLCGQKDHLVMLKDVSTSWSSGSLSAHSHFPIPAWSDYTSTVPAQLGFATQLCPALAPASSPNPVRSVTHAGNRDFPQQWWWEGTLIPRLSLVPSFLAVPSENWFAFLLLCYSSLKINSNSTYHLLQLS